MGNRSLLAAFLGLASAALLWFAITSQAPSLGGFSIIAHDGSVVVSDTDVVSYSPSRHEILLTSGRADALRAGKYLEGPFTVVVNGVAVMEGTFVPPVISRSYPSDEVVITYPGFDMEYGAMKIQMGYPWAAPGTSDVDDAELIRYFASTERIAP